MSSCWAQSQRSDPNNSPVRHCEWIRTNGTPFDTSPMRSTIAVSTSEESPGRSRSKAIVWNTPHRVGKRVDATRRRLAAPWSIMGQLLCLRGRVLRRPRQRAAVTQALDGGRVEPEFRQDLRIVLTELGRAPGRFLGDAADLEWAADSGRERVARAFQRNNDVVGSDLRIL